MSRHPGAFPRGNCLAPTDPALLASPLVFLHEDHLREREICGMLDRIADAAAPDAAGIANALLFLRVELPLHLSDEEQDLFPLLLERCAPEDEIGRVIARLLNDHRHSNADTPEIIALLARYQASRTSPDTADRALLRAYAAHARRHLVLENALILPFSRLRLTADDLETLRLPMMRRRGLA